MITVAGTLVNPLGEPVANKDIRITSTSTELTLLGSEVVVTTSGSGTYSFSLINGTYSVDAYRVDEYEVAGDISVTNETPSPITLPQLLKL